MSQRLPLSAVLALLLTGAFTGCSIARLAASADEVAIANVEVDRGRSPDFVVFRVTVDYRLASRPEGLVGLDIDFGDEGNYRTVTEHHVTQGTGTVQLLAACERSQGGKQRLRVSLSEFPRTLPSALLSSRSRTVALPE